MPQLLSEIHTMQSRQLGALCFIWVELGVKEWNIQRSTQKNDRKLDSKNNCREKWELRI